MKTRSLTLSTSLLQGECSETGLPEAVLDYFKAHPSADPRARVKGSCSIYTQAANTDKAPEVSGISFAGFRGRLFLSSIMLNTADTSSTDVVVKPTTEDVGGASRSGSSYRSMQASDSTEVVKAAFGVSVGNGAQLWMVSCVVAFFGNSNIKAVDSHVFLIGAPPPR